MTSKIHFALKNEPFKSEFEYFDSWAHVYLAYKSDFNKKYK